MGDCGGGCMMLWRNGRRFREILSGGRCMSVVEDRDESLEPLSSRINGNQGP